ncbi:MAG: hypothetical protein B6I31_00835 [Desulfobacteraceae bacterium 4572_19]|nr:MAG: hypothetical protein B6I31_00835 [Desulfobacteraceae bacterium 4572_19]
MLLYAENFDQIKDVSDLVEMYGWVVQSPNAITAIRKTDDTPSTDTSVPVACGERDSNCLYIAAVYNHWDYFVLPYFTPSRRVVFGMQFGNANLRDGTRRSGGPGQWTNTPYLKNTTLSITFRHNTVDLFTIKMTFLMEDGVTFEFENYDSGKENIATIEKTLFDVHRKNFIEFYTDSTGSGDSNGIVKIALNGKTIIIRENVCNSNVSAWGNNPSNEVSFYNNIKFFTASTYSTYQSVADVIIDSLYICNEDGGYHDDFLGPCQITTLYPGSNGDINNWNGFPDGEDNASLVDTPEISGTEEDVTYIEAESEQLVELYHMNNTCEPTQNMLNNPIAVNFRTFVKNMFDYEDMEFDKGLVALTKPSGNEISREYSGKIAIDQYSYKMLDLYYGIVPNLATHWTWEFLDGTQFGMETVQIKSNIFVDDGFSLIDIVYDADNEFATPERTVTEPIVLMDELVSIGVFNLFAGEFLNFHEALYAAGSSIELDISETIGFIDILELNSGNTLTDNIALTGNLFLQQIFTNFVEDSAGFSDTAELDVSGITADEFALSESVLIQQVTNDIVIESFEVTDTVGLDSDDIVNDELNLSETVTPQQVVSDVINDELNLSEEVTVQQAGDDIAISLIELADTVSSIVGKNDIVIDSFDLSDDVFFQKIAPEHVIDFVELSDTAESEVISSTSNVTLNSVPVTFGGELVTFGGV